MQEVEVKEQAGQLVPVHNALTEFEKVSAGLVELTRKYANVVYPVETTKGMDDAKAARLEIRNLRYGVQNAAKDAKSELTAISKNIGERAEQIIAPLNALETPIDEQIKATELRKAEEKRKREDAEVARLALLRARIANLVMSPMEVSGSDADAIKVCLDSVAETAIDESWDEFTSEAADAKDKAVSTLITMHERAVAAEAERAAIAEQREELARQQAELDLQRKALEEARSIAEAARIAEEQAQEAAFQRQEAARIAAEQEAKRLADKAQEDAFAEELKASELAAKLEAETRRADLRSIAGEYDRIASVTVFKELPQEPGASQDEIPMSVQHIEITVPAGPTDIDIVMVVADYLGCSLEAAWHRIESLNPSEINQAIAEAA